MFCAAWASRHRSRSRSAFMCYQGTSPHTAAPSPGPCEAMRFPVLPSSLWMVVFIHDRALVGGDARPVRPRLCRLDRGSLQGGVRRSLRRGLASERLKRLRSCANVLRASAAGCCGLAVRLQGERARRSPSARGVHDNHAAPAARGLWALLDGFVGQADGGRGGRPSWCVWSRSRRRPVSSAR